MDSIDFKETNYQCGEVVALLVKAPPIKTHNLISFL